MERIEQKEEGQGRRKEEKSDRASSPRVAVIVEAKS